MTVDIAAAVAARDAVVRFWRALAADDAAELARVCSAALYRGRRPLGAVLRADMGLDREACARLAVTAALRVLADGSWCFLALPGDRLGMVDVDRPQGVRPLVVRETRAGWVVVGAPRVPLAGAALVVLPPLGVMSVAAGPTETV